MIDKILHAINVFLYGETKMKDLLANANDPTLDKAIRGIQSVINLSYDMKTRTGSANVEEWTYNELLYYNERFDQINKNLGGK